MTGRVLTPRQLQVLALMAEGLTRPQIAARLWLGTATVKTHQRAVYAHFGVRNGPAAVAAGFRTGLLVEQVTSISKEHSTMTDPIALAAELRRTREALRATEFDLGQERQQNVVLLERLTAEEKKVDALRIELRMIEAARRIPAQPPDPDGGLCEPILYERPVRDVATGGML